MHPLAIVHIDPIPTALLNIEPLDHNVLYCTYNEKQRSENKRFGPIMHVLLCSSARAVESGADVTSVGSPGTARRRSRCSSRGRRKYPYAILPSCIQSD